VFLVRRRRFGRPLHLGPRARGPGAESLCLRHLSSMRGGGDDPGRSGKGRDVGGVPAGTGPGGGARGAGRRSGPRACRGGIGGLSGAGDLCARFHPSEARSARPSARATPGGRGPSPFGLRCGRRPVGVSGEPRPPQTTYCFASLPGGQCLACVGAGPRGVGGRAGGCASDIMARGRPAGTRNPGPLPRADPRSG
jgi:hypothetical protein